MADEQEYALFKDQMMSNPDVMAQIQAMPPEEREKYLRNLFRDYTGETEILNEQVAQADALRKTPEAKGRYTQNAYVAANPLEHLAVGLDRYRGMRDYDKAMAGKEGMSADKTATQTQTADFMRPKVQQGPDMVNNANDEFLRRQAQQAELLRMYGAYT